MDRCFPAAATSTQNTCWAQFHTHTQVALQEIWRGGPYREIRGMHRSGRIGEIPLCRSCSRPYETQGVLGGMLRLVRVTLDRLMKRGRR